MGKSFGMNLRRHTTQQTKGIPVGVTTDLRRTSTAGNSTGCEGFVWSNMGYGERKGQREGGENLHKHKHISA